MAEFTEPIKTEKIRGCYLLIKNGVVVYVGQSVNIWARVGVHLANPLKDFDSFCYCEVAGDLNEKEAELIIKHKPHINSSLPNNSRYASSEQIKKLFKLGGWQWRRMKKNINPVWKNYYEIEDVKGIIK